MTGPAHAGNRLPSHVFVPAAGSSRRLDRLKESGPKPFLRPGARAIIEHSLEVPVARGIERVARVPGCCKEAPMDRIGARYGPDRIACTGFPGTQGFFRTHRRSPRVRAGHRPAPVRHRGVARRRMAGASPAAVS